MPAPLLIAAAGAALNYGVNAIKNGAAKKEAERLQNSRPVLPKNAYAQDQLDLAEGELSRGANTEAMNSYNQGLDRDFSNSLNMILKNGGDVNDVGSLFDGTDQGRQRARMMSENIRLQNVERFVRASQYADNASQEQFKFNEWGPWADKAQANAQARQGSANNMAGSFDAFTAAVMRSMSGNPGNEGNSGSASYEPPVSNTRVNASASQYTPPSVSSHFNTIDPNALNNFNVR